MTVSCDYWNFQRSQKRCSLLQTQDAKIQENQDLIFLRRGSVISRAYDPYDDPVTFIGVLRPEHCIPNSDMYRNTFYRYERYRVTSVAESKSDVRKRKVLEELEVTFTPDQARP